MISPLRSMTTLTPARRSARVEAKSTPPQDEVTLSKGSGPDGPERPRGGVLGKIARTVGLSLGLATVGLVGIGAVVPAVIQHPSVAIAPQKMTALQKHLSFFDQNQDGNLTRTETAQGLKKLGLSPVRAEVTGTLINTGIGLKSSDHWYDFTTVNLNKIHQSKHGSDTGIYDTQGQFVQGKYDELWSRFDQGNKGALTQGDIQAMHASLSTDKVGDVASKAEFDLLMELAGQNQTLADGSSQRVLTKERMQQFYDGTLFFQLTGEKAPF
jgi:peroxygenase